MTVTPSPRLRTTARLTAAAVGEPLGSSSQRCGTRAARCDRRGRGAARAPRRIASPGPFCGYAAPERWSPSAPGFSAPSCGLEATPWSLPVDPTPDWPEPRCGMSRLRASHRAVPSPTSHPRIAPPCGREPPSSRRPDGVSPLTTVHQAKNFVLRITDSLLTGGANDEKGVTDATVHGAHDPVHADCYARTVIGGLHITGDFAAHHHQGDHLSSCHRVILLASSVLTMTSIRTVYACAIENRHGDVRFISTRCVTRRPWALRAGTFAEGG